MDWIYEQYVARMRRPGRPPLLFWRDLPKCGFSHSTQPVCRRAKRPAHHPPVSRGARKAAGGDSAKSRNSADALVVMITMGGIPETYPSWISEGDETLCSSFGRRNAASRRKTCSASSSFRVIFIRPGRGVGRPHRRWAYSTLSEVYWAGIPSVTLPAMISEIPVLISFIEET